FNKILKSSDYEYKLKKADEYYANKNYRNAETLYQELFPVFKGSDKFEELYQTNTTKAIGMMQGFINSYPNSPRVADANDIITKCRGKLEKKDYISAKLYYNLQFYQASALTFSSLLINYPESS